MAKDSEPRRRPITVSELIARSESNGSAFPKSASEEDRRTLRRAGASGMPSHPPAQRREGDDGEVGPEANAVTGIIPVVSDSPSDDTSELAPVPADDLVGVDLPPVEQQAAAATQPGVPADDTDVTTTDALGFVDDDDADDLRSDGDADDLGPNDADDEPGTEHRHVASAAELAAAQKAEDDADERARAADKKTKRGEKGSGKPREKSAMLGWLGLIAEVVLGLAVGAGLFWGFTELWKRYVYLALILAVVVIFAIVTFSHVLRKRDLPTTLLALGVGMLVTIGPLVLLAA